jgi:hypothetical protein
LVLIALGEEEESGGVDNEGEAGFLHSGLPITAINPDVLF